MMDVSSVRFPPGAKSISPDLSPAEIVKSLKRCCKFFSQLEQDQEEEKKMYLPFCMYIAENDFITELIDSNARIHLGCIFADIFRLHAPENPFPSDKTRDIFLFLAEQLAHLKNVKSALFSKAYHILENISTVKSFNICLDLDNSSADEVFYEIFRVFFSIVNLSHDAQLKARMLDVMTCIITESDYIPQKLFDILLERLLDRNQKMNPSAYELSRELLRKTARNIEGVVMLFLQNALLGENSEGNILIRNWPCLLSELYKISDKFFVNAIPQLEMKLRTDHLQERMQVVRLLARMFSDEDSDLTFQHPNLWAFFLARFNDIQAEVRIECVNFSSDMMINHGEGTDGQRIVDELVKQLKLRRHDTDEGVRAAVVISIRAIAVRNMKLVTDELLQFLRERLLDKKHKVRETAVRAVADVLKKASSDSNNPSVKFRNRFRILQSQLLRVYYTRNLDDCVLIERVFVSSLVQYSLPDVERMERLLQLFCSVDDQAIKAVTEMFRRQKILRGLLFDATQCLYTKNEADRNQNLWPTILTISSHLHAPIQAREHMKKFFSVARGDKSIFQLLKYLVSEQYTCQKVVNAVRDILKKLEQTGVAKVMRQTIQQFLERVVLVTILVDSSSLLRLTELVNERICRVPKFGDSERDNQKSRAMDLLCVLAKHDSTLYAANECFEMLLGMLRGKDEYIVEKSLLIFFDTAPIIEQRFKLIRTVLLPELKAMAKTAPPYQAKYAVRCMNLFTCSDPPLMQVYQQCKEIATEDQSPSLKLRTVLTTLGCIAECMPSQAGKDLKGFIASVVVKKIIMQTHCKPNRRRDLKWCDRTEVSEETGTKLVAMKCMIRWLCGLKSNDADCCGSTLRLLQHMMHNDGDLMKSGRIPKVEMAHLRLQAAFCIIKIAGCDAYQELIPTSVFLELATLLMDEVREVRQLLLSKLSKSLLSFKVHISFLSLFWVIPQEKVKEHREHGALLYRQLVMHYRAFAKEKAVRSVMPEYALPFTIHLLANDPDVPLKDDIPKSILSRIKDSLNFILDPLLTRDHPESFGFVKRLAEMIKRTKLQGDSDNHQRSNTLYKVCDLVLQSVLARSAQYAIGIVEPPDSAVQKFMPPRLYSKLHAEENHENYLPEAFKIEPKLIPVRMATSGRQIGKSALSEKHSAKLPRKVVAVTKVSLPHHTDSPSSLSNGESMSSSSSAENHQSVESALRRKRPSVEDSSSDEETLAVKRTKLMKGEKQVLEKRERKKNIGVSRPEKQKPESQLVKSRARSNGSTQKKNTGTIVSRPKRGSRQKPQKKTKSKMHDSPVVSTDSTETLQSSPPLSERPKRSSAGSKMFDYLRSTKRTPTKSK